MAEGKFEIFWVTYQNAKFGSEGKEFDPHEWRMAVSTAGGREDAKAACQQYHKNCKVLSVISQAEDICGLERTVRNAQTAQEAKKKPSKKGK